MHNSESREVIDIAAWYARHLEKNQDKDLSIDLLVTMATTKFGSDEETMRSALWRLIIHHPNVFWNSRNMTVFWVNIFHNHLPSNPTSHSTRRGVNVYG